MAVLFYIRRNQHYLVARPSSCAAQKRTKHINNYEPYHLPEKLITLMILETKIDNPLLVQGNGQRLYVTRCSSTIRIARAANSMGNAYNAGDWHEKLSLDIAHSARIVRADDSGTRLRSALLVINSWPSKSR